MKDCKTLLFSLNFPWARANVSSKPRTVWALPSKFSPALVDAVETADCFCGIKRTWLEAQHYTRTHVEVYRSLELCFDIPCALSARRRIGPWCATSWTLRVSSPDKCKVVLFSTTFGPFLAPPSLVLN